MKTFLSVINYLKYEELHTEDWGRLSKSDKRFIRRELKSLL